MKEEIKTDWDKIHFITKVFAALSLLSIFFIIISLIIGIWIQSYPTLKAVETGILIFIISAGVVRIDILDENGDIKEKLRKNT